jgi:molybdopterin synthase sulfur carrier subunit
MHRYRIKAFGITREILGAREMVFETQVQTVAAVKNELVERYPRLSQLRSLYLAVNNSYAEDIQLLSENDEIALIPPVSGG